MAALSLLHLGLFVAFAGLGLLRTIVPVYLLEVAPTAWRGRMVLSFEVAFCAGCLAGLQAAGTALSADPAAREPPLSWRALGVLAAVQLPVAALLPESPQWMASCGHGMAVAAISKGLGLPSMDVEALTLQAESAQQRAPDGPRPKALVTGLALSLLAAAGGITASGPALDTLVILGVKQPLRKLPLVGWCRLLGSLNCTLLCDLSCCGRRCLLMLSSGFCALAAGGLGSRLMDPPWLSALGSAVLFLALTFAWAGGFGGLRALVVAELVPSGTRCFWSGQFNGAAQCIELFWQHVLGRRVFPLPPPGSMYFFVVFGFMHLLSFMFSATVELGSASVAPEQRYKIVSDDEAATETGSVQDKERLRQRVSGRSTSTPATARSIAATIGKAANDDLDDAAKSGHALASGRRGRSPTPRGPGATVAVLGQGLAAEASGNRQPSCPPRM